MTYKPLLTWAVVLCCLSFCAAFTITVDANKEECFYETVSQGDSIGIMYQVVSGGFLDIDLLVRVLLGFDYLVPRCSFSLLLSVASC
jgi:hypothetical protein